MVILLTNMLPSEDMGGVGYLLTIYLLVMLLNMSSVFQTGSALFHSTSRKSEYLATLFILQLLQGVLLAGTASIVLVYLLHNSNYLIDAALFLTIFMFLLVQQIADFFRRISYIENHPISAFMVSLIMHPMRILLIIIVEPTTLVEVLVILLLSALIPVFLMSGKWALLLKRYALKISWRNDVTPHFVHSRWLIASSPLMWGWGAVPVYMLGMFSGLQNVGIFISVRSIANIGNVLMELLETIGATTLGRYASEQSSCFESYLKTIILLGLCVWGVGAIILWYWGDIILRLVYGDEWVIYKKLLFSLWFAQGIIFLFRLAFIKERTKGNTKIVFTGYWFGLFAVITLSPILIKQYQVNGAAYLLIIGATTIYLSQFVLLRKKM